MDTEAARAPHQSSDIELLVDGVVALRDPTKTQMQVAQLTAVKAKEGSERGAAYVALCDNNALDGRDAKHCSIKVQGCQGAPHLQELDESHPE